LTNGDVPVTSQLASLSNTNWQVNLEQTSGAAWPFYVHWVAIG
jgi:hypothetical protein